MAPSSQVLEPPQNPGRFRIGICDIGVLMAMLDGKVVHGDL
jgi:hypothetical protein